MLASTKPELATKLGRLQRLIIIGCGKRFQSTLLPALRHYSANIVAVVDPDVHAIRRVCASQLTQPIRLSEISPAILHDIRPDGAIIASPSGLHDRHLNSTSAAGIRSYVEKPLAATSTQARAALAYAPSGAIAVAEERPFRADIMAIQRIVRMGQLGPLTAVKYVDTIRPALGFANSWRNKATLAGGGVLLDLGYHTLSALAFILHRDLSNLTLTHVDLLTQGLGVETIADVEAYLDNDVKVSLHIGLAREGAPREELRLDGERGYITFSRLRGKSRSRLKGQISGVHLDQSFSIANHAETVTLHRFMLGLLPLDGQISRHLDVLDAINSIYSWEAGRVDEAV